MDNQIRVLTTNDLTTVSQQISSCKMLVIVSSLINLLVVVIVALILPWLATQNSTLATKVVESVEPVVSISVDDCTTFSDLDERTWCQGQQTLKALTSKTGMGGTEFKASSADNQEFESEDSHTAKEVSWMHKQRHCLALNIYHEARSEFDHWATVQGKRVSGAQLVAETTLNRAKLSGKSICATVFEPSQFSWTNDGKSDWASNQEFWKRSLQLSNKLVAQYYIDKRKPLDVTDFYAHYKVQPSWANAYRLVVRVGNHTFLTRS